MSLFVKEKTYMKWTKRDHPIRKNFNYFFNNPIWQNTPPEQFSLCPFFWMSMVGLIGLKLFLVPIWRLFSLLAASTLGVVDKGLYYLWRSSLDKIKGKEGKYEAGRGFCPTFIAIMIITALHVLSQVLGSGLFDVWDCCGTIGRWGTMGALATGIIWVICGLYHLLFDKGDRCRVEWYGIAAIAIWILPWTFLGRSHVGAFFIALWGLAVQFVMWIVSLFSGGGSTWAIGIVAGLVVFYAIVVIVDRLFYKPQPGIEVKKWEITRDMIIDLMAVHLSHEEGCKLDFLVIREFANGDLPKEARMVLRRAAARAVIVKQDSMNHHDAKKIDDMINDRSEVKEGDEDPYTRSEWENNFAKVYDGTTYYSHHYFSSFRVRNAFEENYHLDEVQEAAREELRKLAEFVEVTRTTFARKTEAQRARDEKCKKTVAFVSAPFRFVGSLFSYCWDVFKAKKQGFCPLLTLEPMEEKEADK